MAPKRRVAAQMEVQSLITRVYSYVKGLERRMRSTEKINASAFHEKQWQLIQPHIREIVFEKELPHTMRHVCLELFELSERIGSLNTSTQFNKVYDTIARKYIVRFEFLNQLIVLWLNNHFIIDSDKFEVLQSGDLCSAISTNWKFIVFVRIKG